MTYVHAYNDLTGLTGQVPANHLNHPNLGAHLREVRNGKRRGRLSEIVKNESAPAPSKTRLTDTVAPDKDKEH